MALRAPGPSAPPAAGAVPGRALAAGVRQRALVGLVLATLLALGGAAYLGLDQSLSASEGVEVEALRTARQAGAGVRELVEGARPLLAALAASPEVRRGEPEACAAMLGEVVARSSSYVDLGIVVADGSLLCSARRPRTSAGTGAVGPAAVVRRVAEARDFMPGLFGADPATGAPAVIVAVPMTATDGGVQAAVFAAIDPAAIDRLLGAVALPERATLTVLDAEGTVVARRPEAGAWVGRAVPAESAWRALAGRPGAPAGLADAQDLDGVPRVLAVSRLADAPGAGLAVVAGLARGGGLVGASRRLLALLSLTVLLVAGLAVAWTLGRLAWARGAGARPPGQQALVDQVAELVGQRAREVSFLGQLSGLLQVCLTVEESAGVVRRLFPQFFPGEAGALFVVAAAPASVERVAVWGPLAGEGPPIFGPDECWALRRGRPYVLEDVSSGLACPHLRAALPSAYACVPLVAQGEPLGLLHLASGVPLGAASARAGRPLWTESKQRLMATVPEQLGLALANLRLREKLRVESIRDPLTGLFNRRYMEESLDLELARAERGRQPVGVLLVDIDHFKHFNDTFGHDGGDAVLSALGGLLRGSVRGGDVACRLGGEEFLLILPGASLEEVRRRADELRAAVRSLQVLHHGQPVSPITVSVGVAAHPRHGETREALLRAADGALYRAKHEGRDQVAVAE